MSTPQAPAEGSPNPGTDTVEHIIEPSDSSPRQTEADGNIEPSSESKVNDAVPSTAEDADESTSQQSRESSVESGEASPIRENAEPVDSSAPPLPNEAPPLPNEQPPAEDDGWDFHWSEEQQTYYFYNRITGATTWENPRLQPQAAPKSATAATSTTPAAAQPAPTGESLPAGGYNPAIHGDYDPNAWYAQKSNVAQDTTQTAPGAAAIGEYATIGTFNRFTGGWQAGGDADRHNDENKSNRQMNAYFDVDAVANSHDGRSLKAERSGKKPSKAELKAFKEKRKARKEEKRRAWLRD